MFNEFLILIENHEMNTYTHDFHYQYLLQSPVYPDVVYLISILVYSDCSISEWHNLQSELLIWSVNVLNHWIYFMVWTKSCWNNNKKHTWKICYSCCKRKSLINGVNAKTKKTASPTSKSKSNTKSKCTFCIKRFNESPWLIQIKINAHNVTIY